MPTLTMIRDAARSARIRRTGRPRNFRKQHIVDLALAFCARFSSEKPSSDVNNFFPAFAERFFECATGLSVEDKGCGIDRQVRAAIRRLPIETERAKLLSAHERIVRLRRRTKVGQFGGDFRFSLRFHPLPHALLEGCDYDHAPSSFATTEVLMRTIEYVSPAAIKPNPRNAHTHSKKQIEQIARSIDAFDFTVPVIIDETSTLLAGHGRLEAAKLRGLKKIPAIRLRGLSEAKKRALSARGQQDRRGCRLGPRASGYRTSRAHRAPHRGRPRHLHHRLRARRDRPAGDRLRGERGRPGG